MPLATDLARRSLDQGVRNSCGHREFRTSNKWHVKEGGCSGGVLGDLIQQQTRGTCSQ
jgi:hypothetical protein